MVPSTRAFLSGMISFFVLLKILSHSADITGRMSIEGPGVLSKPWLSRILRPYWRDGGAAGVKVTV